MIEIQWEKDYQGEFSCPNCGQEKIMKLRGFTTHKKKPKRLFKCSNCKKNFQESIDIKDLFQIHWQRDYKIGEFACPNPECNTRLVELAGKVADGRRGFKCLVCGSFTVEYYTINRKSITRNNHITPIKSFCFDDNEWDLRTINLEGKSTNDPLVFVKFNDIKCEWFCLLLKKYIYHLCKLQTPYNTIHGRLTASRRFSEFLLFKNISSIEEINRKLIIDFIIFNNFGTNSLGKILGALKDFFYIGNIQGWFKVDQDIIRHEDYPKKVRGNPDPITDTVREQIEKNLHKLPDPIARMWLIAFFTAMRPGELALLKKDCLVQEGSHWKIIWQRNKTNDYHEVPITRVIAKVVQEQQEYIQNLWGDDWDYLFCHYQGLSKTDLNQPYLKPIKKIIPLQNPTLAGAIRCLIKALDIRDDNGNLAKFTQRIIRHTRLTQLFEQGYDLAIVSAWAGHKNLATTSTYYTHVSCELIEKESGHLQKALLNVDGQYLSYESLPKTFWDNPRAHQLELPENHINTPIYGYCGLPLDQRCDKFRACYTCRCFVAVPEKLPQYVKTRDELRNKEANARESGADVLVEQFQRQADQLDKIISVLEGMV